MKMKLNWKVIIAVALAMGAIYWGLNSVITRSYSGTALNFDIGSGPVTLTNSSDTSLPVALVSEKAGTFSITSSAAGVSGRSVTQRGGSSTTQLYEFTLPPGTTELTVTHGKSVKFVSSTDTGVKSVVKPYSSGDTTVRVIVALVTITVSLFYVSSTYNHMWISAARRQKAREHEAALATEREKFSAMFKRNSPGANKS